MIFVVDNSNRVLLLRRSATDDWMPGRWGLPGGHVEAKESYPQAAVRELREETNLKSRALIPNFMRLNFYWHRVSFISGFSLVCEDKQKRKKYEKRN